ncbi:hypothetical protein I4U23_020228 [Adineta vaga]|nr:hypothetical protein I4U23_020228 [Adineta vaga]
MISNFIQQLTHDNDLFNDQWSDTFDRIKQESVSDDVKLVLNALGEYVLAESSDQSSSELKYTFITMVIERMIRIDKSIEINDLLKIFTHVLEQAKIDRWNLHFLQMIYERFQIGEQLCKIPLKTNLIEQILESFQKKIFTSISSSDEINWQRFLTQSVFSTSIDGRNILNKRNIITNMKTIFQQFYQHAVQQSQSSSIWLEIAKILNESSPKIFTLDTQSNIVLFDSNLPIETISSNYIAHQIQSCKDNIELIKTNFNPLIITIEQLILSNRYKDAYLLLLKLIIPNLSSIDLELFLRKMISLCSIVQQQELFCSEILDPFVRALADLKGMKTLALLFFDLSLAILKLHCIEAPELSCHLLRRKDFYPWKDMVNGLIDCLKTCILYDTLVREANFSSLDRLEDIMEIKPI